MYTGPCGKPQNFVAKRRGISSAILSWNSVECHKQNGAILRYHIYRLRDGNIVNKTVNASGESQSEMFSSLCPFLAYEFQIAAENIIGQGPNANYTGKGLIIGNSSVQSCLLITLTCSQYFDGGKDRCYIGWCSGVPVAHTLLHNIMLLLLLQVS